MIHHLSFYATDYAATKKFYEATLGTLGCSVTAEYVASWSKDWPEQRMCAFGRGGAKVLWIMEAKEKSSPRHVAFSAASHAAVDAFHAAGIAAGGKDNGAPGLRTEYAPDYYAAFAFDPDGNNVEAVFQTQ